MILYPKKEFHSVRDISTQWLDKTNIKALILDVDNTLIDFNKQMPEGTKEWVEALKQQGIQFCILSNSNQKEKVEKVAQLLSIPYFHFAMKPRKKGFQKAIAYFKEQDTTLQNENIAAVGDQIFTDIIGANRTGLYPILVEPIAQKDLWITKIKRPMENAIKKRWRNANEKSTKQKKRGV